MKKTFGAVAVGAFVLVAGCATQTESGAPTADDMTGSEQGSITVGSWTITANTPTGLNGHMRGSATLAGPSGQTTKAGVCMLEMTTTPCTTVADCGSSPTTLPAGGSRYCTNIDNAGQTYCAFRPGSQTSFCAGSPALGGAAVGPGTYTTPFQTVDVYQNYISMGCFSGCATTDPSVSSAGTARPSMCKVYPGTYCGRQVQYCQDNDCDGVSDGVCVDSRGTLFTCTM